MLSKKTNSLRQIISNISIAEADGSLSLRLVATCLCAAGATLQVLLEGGIRAEALD